jgi:hypothetical protein
MSAQPLENLELQALQERNHLHDRAAELKAKVNSTRKKLDLKANVHDHFAGFGVVICTMGLISGYAMAGLFSDK